MRIRIGIDTAKTTHWAVGIDEDGRIVLDRAVENDAPAIDALAAQLLGLDGGLPPKNGSTRNVGLAAEEDPCRRRDTRLRRSSPNCGRSMS